MGEGTEKKNSGSFWKPIAQSVVGGVLLMICTTLYNLFLAHIWPVTIHFGEYSFNNFIFILVAVVSSFLLVVVILGLELYYIFSSLMRGFFNLLIPKDQREKRKHRWYEYILDAFLMPAIGFLGLIFWLLSLKDAKEPEQPVQDEKTQQVLAERLPFLSKVTSDLNKNQPSHSSEERA